DRDPAAEMAAPSIEGQMVPVQSGLDVAAEPFYLSRLAELARRSLRDTATAARIRTTYPGAGMTWTGTTRENDRPRPKIPVLSFQSLRLQEPTSNPVLFWTAVAKDGSCAWLQGGPRGRGGECRGHDLI